MRVNIPLQKISKVSEFNMPAKTAQMLTALNAEGGEIVWDERDDQVVVLVENTHESEAATVVLKAGNGIQGVTDETVTLKSGEYTLIRLESGRFKNVSGSDKGKVVLQGNTSVKVAVFVTP